MSLSGTVFPLSPTRTGLHPLRSVSSVSAKPCPCAFERMSDHNDVRFTQQLTWPPVHFHRWILSCCVNALQLLRGSRVGPHVGCVQFVGTGNIASSGRPVVLPCAHTEFLWAVQEERIAGSGVFTFPLERARFPARVGTAATGHASCSHQGCFPERTGL